MYAGDRQGIIDDTTSCLEQRTSKQCEMSYQFMSTKKMRDLVVNYVYVPPDVVMVHTEDVTERKQAEDALKEKQQRLDSLMSNVDAIILEGDPSSLTYIGGNVENILGYPLQAWYDDPGGPLGFWTTHLHPDDQETFNECAEAISRGEDHSFEYRMLAADGRYTWFYDHVTVEARKDAPIKTRSVMVDITERKQAEEALSESVQRLSFHLQNTPVAYIEWDLDFNVSEWNTAAEKTFGYKKKEAMGKHAAELIVPQSAREHVDTIWKALLKQKGGTHSINENFTKKGKTIILIKWTVSDLNKSPS